MQLITRYGQSAAERRAEEAEIAREIVKEITADLRVSQRQLMLIIHGLAMNLEQNCEMLQITSAVRALRDDLFIIDTAAGAETAEGGKSGKICA